jgi:hypothetical protein
MVTAVDKLATEAIEGFRHEMIMYTPAYKGKIDVPGMAAAVVAVSKGMIPIFALVQRTILYLPLQLFQPMVMCFMVPVAVTLLDLNSPLAAR